MFPEGSYFFNMSFFENLIVKDLESAIALILSKLTL